MVYLQRTRERETDRKRNKEVYDKLSFHQSKVVVVIIAVVVVVVVVIVIVVGDGKG